jgi:hypothetical protein
VVAATFAQVGQDPQAGVHADARAPVADKKHRRLSPLLNHLHIPLMFDLLVQLFVHGQQWSIFPF